MWPTNPAAKSLDYLGLRVNLLNRFFHPCGGFQEGPVQQASIGAWFRKVLSRQMPSMEHVVEISR